MIERENQTIAPDTPADYATLVGQWVSETVPEVEAAIDNGTANELLQLPNVREVLGGNLGKFYYFLANARTTLNPTFRKDWISTFLHDFQQSLQPPKRYFPAYPCKRLRTPVSQPPSITIVHEQKETLLRYDQVLSARAWGVWFNFDDELLERAYLAGLIRTAVSRLASQIKHLTTIQSTPAADEMKFTAAERHEHSQFCRLLIDVFNESDLAAHEVLDQSEVLLSLPAFKLTTGAQVHVFSGTGPVPSNLTSGTSLREQSLTIAPWELARAVINEIAAPRSKGDKFWSSWAGDDIEVTAITERLALLFSETAEAQPTHPLGPIASLPPQIKNLVRSYPTWKARGGRPDHWLTQTEIQHRTANRYARAPTTKIADVQVTALRISEAIEALENALHDASLPQRIEDPELQSLLGPALTQRYRAMSLEKIQHSKEFRTNWIRRIVAVFQQTVQAPLRTFPAKAHCPWTAEDQLPPSLLVTNGAEVIVLRPDQVLSARRWGTWFTFEDSELERFYVGYLLFRSLIGLTSNIKNLWNLESTYLSGFSTLKTEVDWQTGRRAGWFERLLIDVLNENASIARPAQLAEDILEKTDLRVSYPSCKRKDGTRVQVSLTSNPEWHDQKVDALLAPDEFIVLTPLELARTAVHPPTHALFSNFNWEEFWIAFGGRKSVHDLALQFHALFDEALSIPPRHPLGPMWHILPVIRRFIRIYTEQRAERINITEPSRQSNSLIDVGHIYTTTYWKQKFSKSQQP